MPRRVYKKKKRTFKRKIAKIGRPPRRALSAPRPYYFKRTLSNTVTLSSSDEFWTSTGSALGKAFAFSLSAISDDTDFINLFKYYRLKGARVRMYFSNTGSVPVGMSTGVVTVPNSQILVTIDRNMNGETTGVANEDHYLQSQTAKRRVALGGDRRPIDIYMPLKQGNLVYQTSTLSNNTLVSPKWISTGNPDTPHWGYNIMLQRVDGENFTAGISNQQSVKMLTTLYFQCKKVE